MGRKRKYPEINIGDKFERLEVIDFAPPIILKSGYKQKAWLCKCSCGKVVIATDNQLITSKRKSCGCLQKESQSKNGLKRGYESASHRMIDTRLYSIWHGMRKRCLNPKDANYAIYGGKGVSICTEWLDFINFYNWAVNNGYEELLTIDRIDVNGNYCPENCRWTTMKEQNNNRTSNIFLTIDGETRTVAQWSKFSSVSQGTIYKRLYKNWEAKDAVFAPLGTKTKDVKAKENNNG